MAYSIMNGVMTAGVSAGSNHVGASETWTAHVTWPSGAAETGAPMAVSATNTTSATARVTSSSPRGPSRLLAEPHRVELLVQEVAGHDRPAPHLGEVRDDPVPLEAHDEVHFLVVEALLELAQEALAFLGIDRPRLPGVEVVHHGVLVLAVVHRGGGEEPVDVEVGLDDGVTRRRHRHLEVAVAERAEP